jgi:anti-sigma-K factor RskA
MTDELRFPDSPRTRVPRDSDALDERVTRVIHAAYLPPVASAEAATAYWSALEKRVMARVRSAAPVSLDQGWWSVLNGWSQMGMVAAAALLMIAGVVGNSLSEPDEQVSYESVVPSSPEAISAPIQLVTASDKSVQRDAALQYVLSY